MVEEGTKLKEVVWRVVDRRVRKSSEQITGRGEDPYTVPYNRTKQKKGRRWVVTLVTDGVSFSSIYGRLTYLLVCTFYGFFFYRGISLPLSYRGPPTSDLYGSDFTGPRSGKERIEGL